MSSVQEQAHSPPPFRWHYAEFDDSSFQIRGRTLFFIVILLSAVLVIALLFIYARWLCVFHPPPPAPATASSVHSAPDPPPRGLDVVELGKMPIVLYENSAAAANFSEGECCICLGIFGDKEKVKVLQQCRHCFHSECVDKWLAAESSCPLCRASLRVVDDSPV